MGSSMVLSHVDALPHLHYDTTTRKAYTTFSRNGQEIAQNAKRALKNSNDDIHFNNNMRKIGNSYPHNRDRNTHEYDDNDNKCSNWYRKLIKITSSISLCLASFLLYVGTCPILFQRIIVTLPNPLLASFIGTAIALLVNIDFYFWIICVLPLLVAIGIIISLFFTLVSKILSKYHSEMHVRKDEKEHLERRLKDAARRNVVELPVNNNSNLETDNNDNNNDNVSSNILPQTNRGDNIRKVTTTSATSSTSLIEQEANRIIVESELREKRRKASISRRKELQGENLQRRIKNRSTKLNTSTFGKRSLSRATSNAISFRYRRPIVADVAYDTNSNNNSNHYFINSYHNNSNNYNLEYNLENRGGGGSDSSVGSDHEIDAYLALSRRNSVLKKNGDMRVVRLSTKLFDMEVEEEVAAVNLKVEQARRREKVANRMKARLKEKYDSFAHWLASSSDDDGNNVSNYTSSEDSIDLKSINMILSGRNTSNNTDSNDNNDNDDDNDNDDIERHETMIVRKVARKKPRKKKLKKNHPPASSSAYNSTNHSQFKSIKGSKSNKNPLKKSN